SGLLAISGCYGLAHFASLIVRLRNLLDASFACDPNTADLAREFACAAINRLIEAYRQSTCDFRTRSVMPQHDVFAFEVKYVSADGNERNAFSTGGSSLIYPVPIRELNQVRSLFGAI